MATIFDNRNRVLIEGPIGNIDVVINEPDVAPRGIALVAHPHPLFGGTLDNKVAVTLAKAFVELGMVALRPNFRGVGASEGKHDEGLGETDDFVAVHAYAVRTFGALPLYLAGFSFGGFVQSRVYERLGAKRLILVAPAMQRGELGEVPTDTLLIHGENDDTVPLSLVLEWARPRELPIVLVPGADHFFHRKLHIVKRLTIEACRA